MYHLLPKDLRALISLLKIPKMLRSKYTAVAHLAVGYFCMTHTYLQDLHCQTLKDKVQSQKKQW